MAIDIRAGVTCSLGTVISGSIGDDYIQGSGLIKTQGSVLISGLITPDIGTIVTFGYSKSGITRSIPRKLRVMSSFADPYRRTTQVELGCKLTYLSDLEDPIDWTAFDDPENEDRTEEESRIVTIPIQASSIMNKCLAELGISGSNPLTNSFSIATFSFDGGYVSILSDLLVSESYCGYLDKDEVLQVFPLDQDVASGPVFGVDDIVDIGPIGVGQLPGEAVTVSYSTLKLKPPEPPPGEDASEEEEEEYQDRLDRINWEQNVVTSSPELYYINYRDAAGVLQTKSYTSTSSTKTTTDYKVIRVRKEDGEIEDKEVVNSRTVTETVNAIAKLSNCAAKYAEAGIGFNNASITTLTFTAYGYDEYGNERSSSSLKSEPEAALLGAANFEWVYGGVAWPAAYARIPAESIRTTSSQSGNYTQKVTSTYLRFAFTQAGQQTIAIARELGAESTEIAAIIVEAALGSGLVHSNTTTETSLTGASQSQERPPAAERINAELSKDGDPNNGWRTESQADLELAVGSATAQRRIELSMTYAPDDIFTGPIGGPYSAIPSDAPVKANRYGRVQNRLLLGNRNGISLQLAPERLPAAPYSPLYVEANGLTAMYRANGTSWAFDGNGIVASVDALFWGAAGGTGTFWFPVAPGIVTLPSAPTVIDTSPTEVIGTIETVGATPQTVLDAAFPSAVSGDGVQDETSGDFWVYDGSSWNNVGTAPGPTTTPSTIVLPYNETSIYNSIVRTRLDVTKFDYSLFLLTEVPLINIYVGLVVQPSSAFIIVPATAVNVVAHEPIVASGVSVALSVTAITLEIFTPGVSSGGSVTVLLTEIVVEVNTVPYIGSQANVLQSPLAAAILFTPLVPAVASGVSVSVDVSDIVTASLVPIVSSKAPPVVSLPGTSRSGATAISPDYFSVQTNDILLLVVETSGDGTNVIPRIDEPGWNILAGTPLYDDNVTPTFGSKLHVWWYRAAAPITGGTVGFDDSGDHQVGRVYLIRGCVATGNPFDVIGTATKATPSTTASAPSVTTTVVQTRIFSIVSQPVDSSSTAQFGAPANTGLTSLTDVDEVATNSNNGGGFVIATGIRRLPGNTGAITYSSAPNTSNAAITIAFKP